MSYVRPSRQAFPQSSLFFGRKILADWNLLHRRRAQNRQAQRKFRIRQQQALDETVAKLKEIEKLLHSAESDKQKFRSLYEECRRKYARLLKEKGERDDSDD